MGLSPETIAAIQGVLREHGKIERAAVFGSRAKGTHRKYSDIDIALWGEITPAEAESIRADLDELPTIYEYDVLAYSEVASADVKAHIDRRGIIIYTGR